MVLKQTPEAKHMGNSTSPKKAVKEVKRALGAMKAVDICSVGDSKNFPKYFQSLNLRRFHDGIRTWAQSKRVAQAAADLLGVEHVRLYQDGFFRKGDTEGTSIAVLNAGTNIHRDSDMTPVGGQHYVTAWCPLRPIDPEKDSTLIFWDGSHVHSHGVDDQDSALKSIASDPHPRTDDQNLEEKYLSKSFLLNPDLTSWDQSAVRRMATNAELDRGEFPDVETNNFTLLELLEMKKELAKGRQRVPRVTEEEARLRGTVCGAKVPKHGETWSPYFAGTQLVEVCDPPPPAGPLLTSFGKKNALLNEMWEADKVKSQNFWQGARTFGKLDLGDCTFHHGETTHAAAVPPQRDLLAGQTTKDAPPREVREAVTLTYMGAESCKIPLAAFKKMSGVKDIKDQEDYASYSRWYDDIEAGAVIDHEECPIIV